MLVAVAEASLVRVPPGVTVLVLQRHTGCSAYLGGHQQPETPRPEGREAQTNPTVVGKKTHMALLERDRLTFV